MSTRARRRLRQVLVGGAVLAIAWMVAPPVSEAVPTDVSGSLEDGGHSLTYSLSGVTSDEDDQPGNHTGTVTADQVSLTGTATYTIEEGFATNLGMSASLSVGDQSASDSWPPEGVDGRVGGTTVTFPFSLTVDVPDPPDETEDVAPPFGDTVPGEDEEPQPYATLSFSVSSRNCNDSGVCGGPSASGSFAVFDTGRTSSPTVDWIAAVGALGAAAAAAAAAGIIGRSTDDDGEGDDDRWRYVLQVATDSVTVDAAAGANLAIEVWAVNAQGAAMPVPDASVSATVSGPFSLAPPSGQGSLHAGVTATGPPGSTGTAAITASAGPMQMSTTVQLTCEGAYQLELAPVGEAVIRPDPNTGRYTTALIDVRMLTTSATGPQPVDCALTATEATPEGLVALSQEPAPGPTPAVRLHVDLDADPAALVDPANQSVQLTVWAEPTGVTDADAVTGTISVRLEAPTSFIHWMRTGHPETLDSTIELEAEEDAVLDLEVWLETTDGTAPPAAEFSHMVNVDLADNQLPPTKADFSCHTDSKPWQKPAADNRAHSRWRVNHALPSADRPDLVPPIDTAIRVRAWKLGSVEREVEELTATEKRLAQTLVPVRLGPVQLLVELVEPTEPVLADGGAHDVTLRVRRERDGAPYIGPVQVAVAPVEGRTVSTIAVDRYELGQDADGEFVVSVTTPELTYRRDVAYTETLQVSVPARTGPGNPVGDVPVALAPAVSLQLTRAKKGLLWEENPTIERPASDRVSTITGQVRVTTKQSRPPEQELDVVVNLADTAAVVPPDPIEKPAVTAASDETGRVELRLPGLEPSPDAQPIELDFDEFPRGVLAPDVAERLDLYETRVLKRVQHSSRPLSALVGTAHADTIGTWRFETTRLLAAHEEERHDDILATIELAEAAGVYTHTFAVVYYDLLRESRDVLGSLLGDALGIAFTVGGVGEQIAKRLGPWIRSAIDAIDSWILAPTLTMLRTTLRRIMGVVDQIILDLPLESVELKRTAAELKRLFNEVISGSDDSLFTRGIQFVFNAIAYAGRAIHGAVLGLIRRLLPPGDTMMRYLGPALGPHLDPAWNKLAEDSFKQILDWLEVVPWAAGGVADQIKARLDIYPHLATTAAGHVLGDLSNLRLPADPALRREQVDQLFDLVNQQAFEHRRSSAEIDDWLAIIGFAITLIQLALLFYSGLTKAVKLLNKKIGAWLDIGDLASGLISGAAHLYEMSINLLMAYGIGTFGTGAVKEMTT